MRAAPSAACCRAAARCMARSWPCSAPSWRRAARSPSASAPASACTSCAWSASASRSPTTAGGPAAAASLADTPGGEPGWRASAPGALLLRRLPGPASAAPPSAPSLSAVRRSAASCRVRCWCKGEGVPPPAAPASSAAGERMPDGVDCKLAGVDASGVLLPLASSLPAASSRGTQGRRGCATRPAAAERREHPSSGWLQATALGSGGGASGRFRGAGRCCRLEVRVCRVFTKRGRAWQAAVSVQTANS